MGFRNLQKALLYALVTPDMKDLQDSGDFTGLLVRQEELKTMPFGDVWNTYCQSCGVPEDGRWLDSVKKYEAEVLLQRR